MLQRKHTQLIHWLEWVDKWRLLLQAFDTVFSVTMQEMLVFDMERLEMFITVYHDRMGWIKHDIIYNVIAAPQSDGFGYIMQYCLHLSDYLAA